MKEIIIRRINSQGKFHSLHGPAFVESNISYYYYHGEILFSKGREGGWVEVKGVKVVKPPKAEEEMLDILNQPVIVKVKKKQFMISNEYLKTISSFYHKYKLLFEE